MFLLKLYKAINSQQTETTLPAYSLIRLFTQKVSSVSRDSLLVAKQQVNIGIHFLYLSVCLNLCQKSFQRLIQTITQAMNNYTAITAVIYIK